MYTPEMRLVVDNIQVLRVYLTPKDLRDIADILDRSYDGACIGEEVPRYKFVSRRHHEAEPKIEVELVIDQEAMTAQGREFGTTVDRRK